MSDDRQRRKRTGFTLVDVVVVTAFCGLLIAIILPPAQQVRRQAQDMVCMSNLHQQYQAASEYAGDNAGYYPRGILGRNNSFGLGEYNVYATALLPYLGWTGTDPLWRSRPPGVKATLKRTNRILLDFDVFHCPGFPVDYYDDPVDHRYFYDNALDEELYGPGGENPLHYVSSAFPMPYGPYSIYNDGSDLCWDADGSIEGFSAPSDAPYYYAESSTLDSFPANCPPESKVYVTGVDKTMPWIEGTSSGTRDTVGIRFYSAFLTSHLGFSSHGRINEYRRHPRGMNSLFFDGHVRPIATDKLDPGCETTLDYRLRFFTVPWEGWDGWDVP